MARRPLSVDSTLNAVRDLYTSGLQEHGAESRAVGWKDEDSQRLRFEKLAQVIEAGSDAVTVGDWGCGYAAMFGFLEERLHDRLTSYHGCDISAEMVDAARMAVIDPRAHFEVGEALPAVDYVFVSGTFNVRFAATDAEWEDYVESCLVRLAATARLGLAFNLLSTYVDWREPHLFYADPCALFNFCKRRLSPRVALLHDYPLYEWTILVTL